MDGVPEEINPLAESKNQGREQKRGRGNI
jgi:hypothetical protein